eukprot:6832545-Alexandrium_andersonii.AAC.1
MSASLVGSEMCIRDRSRVAILSPNLPWKVAARPTGQMAFFAVACIGATTCLLYTSDAADDM